MWSSKEVFIIFGCDIFKNKRKFNQLQNSPLDMNGSVSG